MASRRQAIRTRTPSVDVTASLEAAALELLEDSGPAALTVREVAARAGVAPMGVYSRFGGKDGLLEALFVHGFTMLAATFDAPSRTGALARLHSSFGEYRAFALAHPRLYHLMFEQMMTLELAPESLEIARRAFANLVRDVAACMDAGELSPGDPVEAAQHLWSAMHGSVTLEIAEVSLVKDRERAFTALLDALLFGLGAPANRIRRS